MKVVVKQHGMPQAKGYSEAGASRVKRAMKGFTAVSGSPNEDINWNNKTLRQRGRMLTMSSPIAASAINTNRTKVVGSGLSLQCVIDNELLGMSPEAAKAWQQKTEAEFLLWASKKQNCDAIGVNNFEGLQQQALKAWLSSGDVFVVFKRYDETPMNPYSLRVHVVEADRISTPMDTTAGRGFLRVTDGKTESGNKIFDGVEVNKNGMIVAYYIRNTYPEEITEEKTDWVRVDAYGKNTGLPNILQVMESERPEQYRGVTYLAPVIEPLLQLRRYTESELMAALVQSFFTAWITTEGDASEIPMNEVGPGDMDVPSEAYGEISDSPNEYEMGPGTVNVLQQGEDIKFGSPNIPSAGFDVFVKAICREIGAGLEMPYDVLVKEFNSSYSAARGALLEAWEAIRMRRKWFVDDFCQPIYEIWLTEAVARGRIKAPGFFDDPLIRSAWCGARWIGPVQGQLDPLKEAKANVIQVDHAFKTHEQITRENGGGDWGENVTIMAVENEHLKAAGGGNYMTALNSNEGEGGETAE